MVLWRCPGFSLLALLALEMLGVVRFVTPGGSDIALSLVFSKSNEMSPP